MSEKIIRLPVFNTATLNKDIPSSIKDKYEEYELKERWLRMGVILNGLKPEVAEGDIDLAILEDLQKNNLKAVNIKVISTGPVVVNATTMKAYIEVFYKAHFKVR